ncbi:PaaI family thioesterase [Aestuariibius sp. HNIBRBA575]|uniref:PaaI family thioesterase n=1 Tax=Aestuariibius sp. HNIBRBA575 TaxID=3233343 RepID=UPI0034A0E2F1
MFIAQSKLEMPTKETLLSMSGYEFMRGILAGQYSSAPISDVLNFGLDVVEDGRVVFRGTPRFEHSNPMGTVHGGWYGTVLDSCMACAVMTKIPKGTVYTTLEYKVNLLRAIPLETEVVAEGRVDHVGRSTGVAHGEIRGVSDGKLYATGSTTCLVMTLPS